MIRSLRRKFVLITITLVSLVLLAVFFGIWFYSQASMEQQSYLALQMALDRQEGDEPWFKVGGDVPDGYRGDPAFVVSVDSQGATSLLSSDRITVDTEELGNYVSQALSSGQERGELSDYDLRYIIKQEGDGSIRIAFAALSFERDQISNVVLVTAVCVAAVFVVFLFASLLLARWALKPVEQSWEQQNRFVADASHELKTPLTVILANSGILKTGRDTSGEQRVWVESTEKEAKRMKGLIDDMLFLAKRDDGSPPTVKTSHNTSSILETSTLAFESVAFERGLSLDIRVEPDIRVISDASQLKQLVGILLDNAIKYAKDNSEIVVELHKHSGHAVLSVFNESAPIPPEQQKHLFERFYRTDASRSTGGSGLGLSIAQSIVEEHKGKISVGDAPGGIVFTVSLPLE